MTIKQNQLALTENYFENSNNLKQNKLIIFSEQYNFLLDLTIPENVPKYLKKAVTIFNELIMDLRGLSIRYEKRINGLYALIIALEKVNLRYIEKRKSRNNNPQTAKQQLEARLQICKNMKQVLKDTKKI